MTRIVADREQLPRQCGQRHDHQGAGPQVLHPETGPEHNEPTREQGQEDRERAAPRRRTACPQVERRGGAKVGGQKATWSIAAGSLVLTPAEGRAAGFYSVARDILVSRTGLVLWRVSIPTPK